MILKILHWVCRCLLAGVFIYSGYIKLQATLQFAVAISGYQLVPETLILPLATYLPWIEVLLGVLLLIGWKIRYVSMATAGLLLMFTIVLTITYLRGIDANCGCFGFDDPISPLTIARDGAFFIPAIFLAFESRIRLRYRNRGPALDLAE